MASALKLPALVLSFILSGTAAQGSKNAPKCGVAAGVQGGVRVDLTDGTYDRCISVITPPAATKPMPVVFWFHGAHGSAANCGQSELGQLAAQFGFALVCGEALQGIYGMGGEWTIPEVQTDETGTRCGDDDTLEVPYIKSALAYLNKYSDTYDTARIFTSGCSMGSGMSTYTSNCIKKWAPANISAFATHSTGLKEKGDGLTMWPKEIYDKKYAAAECPECQYFPVKPEHFGDSLGLKACVFDNQEDPTERNPIFYESSVRLAGNWTALGNRAETNFAHGGHCEIHSYADIVKCLDDGSGRLLGKGRSLVV